MSISICTILIVSMALVFVGPMSLGKTNIDTFIYFVKSD